MPKIPIFNPTFIGDMSADNKCMEKVSSFYFWDYQSLVIFEVPYSTYQWFISLNEKRINTIRTITFVVTSPSEGSIGGLMSFIEYVMNQNKFINMNLILPSNIVQYQILAVIRAHYIGTHLSGKAGINVLTKSENEVYVPPGGYMFKSVFQDYDSYSCIEIKIIPYSDNTICKNIYYNGKHASIFPEGNKFENISKLIIDVSNNRIRNVKKKELFDILSQNHLLLANTIFTGFYDDAERDFYLDTQKSILSKNELPDKDEIKSQI